MKTIKIFYSLSMYISVFFFNSCIKGDSATPCNSFIIESNFTDSILGLDLTGDSINGLVRYFKDSIKYKIISPNINVSITSPVITTASSINTFATNPFSLANINDEEKINLIFYLNTTTIDTININIKNKTDFSIYYKNKLLSRFETFRKCKDLIYIKK